MGQFIFHCNIKYLNFIKKRKWIFKENEWWYILEAKDCHPEIKIYLHLHEKDEPPLLEIKEEYREEILWTFFNSVLSGEKELAQKITDKIQFEHVYAIDANKEEDFRMIENVSKNANRLVLIHPEEEYADVLRWRLLWDMGLIIEQYTNAHFFPSGDKKVLILSFSENQELKIPYRRLPEGSIFLEMGLKETYKRGIFQKNSGVTYYSLYDFLDNMLKNRYNSLVNMGKLNQFQIKIKNKVKKEKEPLWKQRKTF